MSLSDITLLHSNLRFLPRTFTRDRAEFVTAHCMLLPFLAARMPRTHGPSLIFIAGSSDSATAGTAGKKERVMDARTRTILEMGKRALAFAEAHPEQSPPS